MKNGKSRLSRRNFLLKGGIAAVAALAAGVTESVAARIAKKASEKPPAVPPPKPEEPPVTLSSVELTLTVNRKKHVLTVPAGKTLAEVLRQDLGLSGVKIGCGAAECGACTVLVNGRPMYSCMTLAVLANQSVIETIEGITESAGGLHPIQKSFVENDALQCGYCTPGMICATKALLIEHPHPTDDEIRAALSGNLCRCGTYENVVKAVRSVTEKR